MTDATEIVSGRAKSSAASAVLQQLRALRDKPRDQLERIAVVVVAHPDDEVIGLGGLLPRLHHATFIYTTDGAPGDMNDAERAGFTSRESYKEQRQTELQNAFRLAGIRDAKLRSLPFVDKETTLNLAELTGCLRAEFEALQPSVVFTHAYEGGHPDHDSTAFAVHHALRLYNHQRAQDGAAPVLLEFTSYHEHESTIRIGEFIVHQSAQPAAQPEAEITIELSPAALELKRQMFQCFTSQAVVLNGFQLDYERFRVAPRYDFQLPPHTGRLHYETFGWNWTGERWRELARKAAGELER